MRPVRPVEALRDVLDLDDLRPQARRGARDLDLGGGAVLRRRDEGRRAVHAGLLLRRARLGAAAEPRELPLCQLRRLLRLGLLHDLLLGLLLEVVRVAADVARERPLVDLDHAVRDALEHVAVVRDEHQRAREAGERLLEPLDRLGVEVVRGLVEDEQVRLLDERAGEGDALALPARERLDAGVGVGQAQTVQQGARLGVERPRAQGVDRRGERHHALDVGLGLGGVRGGIVVAERPHRLAVAREDGLQGRVCLGEDGALREEADARRAVADDPPAVRRLDARRDAQQRRLAGPVDADHADLLVGLDHERRVVQERADAVGLADSVEGEERHGAVGRVQLAVGRCGRAEGRRQKMSFVSAFRYSGWPPGGTPSV